MWAPRPVDGAREKSFEKKQLAPGVLSGAPSQAQTARGARRVALPMVYAESSAFGADGDGVTLK